MKKNQRMRTLLSHLSHLSFSKAADNRVIHVYIYLLLLVAHILVYYYYCSLNIFYT